MYAFPLPSRLAGALAASLSMWPFQCGSRQAPQQAPPAAPAGEVRAQGGDVGGEDESPDDEPGGPSSPAAHAVQGDPGLAITDVKPLFRQIGDGADKISWTPDQQTPILRAPDGSYQLFMTGRSPEHSFGVYLVRATDLADPNSYSMVGNVLRPSCNCKPAGADVASVCGPESSDDSWTSYYGMLSVFRVRQGDPNQLFGYYIADRRIFAGDTRCGEHGSFFGQIGLATSNDGGRSWQRHGIQLRGEPLPRRLPGKAGPQGVNQPTFIRTEHFVYAFLDYFPSGQWPRDNPIPHGKKAMHVARAPIEASGLPGRWTKFYRGSFDSGQDGMTGLADDVMPEAADGGRPVSMGWISYNTYLHKYLMTMVVKGGWYYSTLPEKDLDKEDWSRPVKFFSVPGEGNFQQGQPTWDNLVFVTPGTEDNHVTGQEGYAFFKMIGEWGKPRAPRSAAIAKFKFSPAALGQ